MGKLIAIITVLLLAATPAAAQMTGSTIKGGTISGTTPSSSTVAFIIGQTLGTPRADFDGCVGIVFDTPASSPPTISELGRWKIAGNSQTHGIYLRSCDGNNCNSATTFRASASIDASLGTNGAYQYASITPFATATSQRYLIVTREFNGGDQFYDADTVITSVTAAGGTYVGPVYTTITTCDSGFNASPASTAYVPTNFKF